MAFALGRCLAGSSSSNSAFQRRRSWSWMGSFFPGLLFAQQACFRSEKFDGALQFEFPRGVLDVQLEMKRARVGSARLLEDERLDDFSERPNHHRAVRPNRAQPRWS